MTEKIAIPDELIHNKIYLIRGQKVMIDRDLAKLYGVETKCLKRQVRRNIERFPKDFIFEMSKEEFQHWRSQFVTSNVSDKMGLRYVPFVFTEQGVAMLSSVLNSQKAIAVNIKIIRVFTKIREMLSHDLRVKLEIEEIKKKLSDHDKHIELVFKYLDKLLEKKENEETRRRIGYKKD